MATARERIEKIKAEQHIRASVLSKLTGIKPAVFSDIKSERVEVITLRVATAIHKVFPEYTVAWLVGDEKPESDTILDKLEALRAERDRQITMLRTIIEKLNG